MKTKFGSKFKIILLIALLSGLIIWAAIKGGIEEGRQDIHIALACPVSGPEREVGNAFIQGAKLFIRNLEAQGGIKGINLILDIYDDQNNPALAEKMAEDIADDPKVKAIIGHHFSTCSIQAGKVYKKHKLPAITPSSTHIDVTRGNDYYFRTIFNDNLQSRFLANYMKKVLRNETVSIIQEDADYGRYLAETFEDAAKSQGIEVKYKWEFNVGAEDLDWRIREIVYDLQTKNDAGAVFLAVHAEEAVQLVKYIKDTFIRLPVFVPDSCSSKRFVEGFAGLPKEIRNPGFYTKGIYVTTPMIFDTAGEKALQFKEDFRKRYHEEPGWRAAYAYDSLYLITEAIKRTGITGDPYKAKAERKKIRNFLAGMNKIENALEGVTGLHYFDENGDSAKPITIGVYKQNNIISALSQFQPVSNLNDVPDPKTAIEKEQIQFFGGKYMYKTNVVYTGLKVSEIKEINLDDMVCDLDFYIWFRYYGNFEASHIEFLNAVEPMELGEPVEEVVSDNLVSILFHVNGKFKMQLPPDKFAFGHKVISVSFCHRELTRNNLVYVVDYIGMGLDENDKYLDRFKRNHHLNMDYRLSIYDVRFFHDTIERDLMGTLKYLDQSRKEVEFSQYNFQIWIKKNRFSLRGLVPYGIALDLTVVSCILILLIELIIRKKGGVFSTRLRKLIWVVESLLGFVLLLTSEVIIINAIGDTLDEFYLRQLITLFDMLWWLIPAYLLKAGLQPFIWRPMEERTGRPTPNVLRRFVAYLIYFFAAYGIVVHVFNQNITKLMATSGAIAMVIGFIIKANISNFFSGIIINRGESIRIGDWVKIGSFDEAKVADITWRSTKLEKSDGSMLSIPNAVVSDSVVENFTFDAPVHEVEIPIYIDPEHHPDRISKILTDAMLSTEGVLKDPEPFVKFTGFTDWAACYHACFFVSSYEEKGIYAGSVWKRIWTHLNLSGIPPAIRERETKTKAVSESKGKVAVTPLEVLKEIEIFQAFDQKLLFDISERVRLHQFKAGETIVQQGDSGDSLFITAEGVVGVWIKHHDMEPYEIVRMGAGSLFGEMALLTGEPRNATVVSVSATTLYEIRKEDLVPCMESNPEIVNRLSFIMAERKIIEESGKHEESIYDTDKTTLYDQLVGKIREFFGKKD